MGSFALGTNLTNCEQSKADSCSNHTGTKQSLTEGPGPSSPGAPPTTCVKGHGQTPPPDTHVDRLGKLPGIPEHTLESVELVQFSSVTHTKPALLLLNPRFDHRLCPPLQNPGVDLAIEAEECDLPRSGAHPSVPLLEKRNCHPGLPVHRLPSNVIAMWQPQLSFKDIQSTFKDLKYSVQIFSVSSTYSFSE